MEFVESEGSSVEIAKSPCAMCYLCYRHWCRRTGLRIQMGLGEIFLGESMCAIGLNSHCFPMVGDKLINPIVGVYIPIIRIPIKGWMTIPNTRSLDPGSCEL